MLRELERMSSQVDFEDLVAIGFEQMLELETNRHLYEYIYNASTRSNVVIDLPELIQQAQAVVRYVKSEYWWLVESLVFDSCFIKLFEVDHLIIDFELESISIMFKEYL